MLKKRQQASKEYHRAYFLHRYHNDPLFRSRLRAKAKRNYLKSRAKAFGIKIEDFLARLSSKCEICERSPSETKEGFLIADHDHKTELFRGVLCKRCNLGVGLLGDRVEGILKTLNYLRGHRVEIKP